MNKEINGWHVDDLKLSHIIESEVMTSVIKIIGKEFAKHKPLTIEEDSYMII